MTTFFYPVGFNLSILIATSQQHQCELINKLQKVHTKPQTKDGVV